jgi:hypothetical protein
MDTSRVGPGALLAGASGLLLIIFMFFGWFELTGVSAAVPGFEETIGGEELQGLAEAEGQDTVASAWQSFGFIDIILFLVALAAIGLAVLAATGARLDLPVPAGTIVAALGGLAVLLILFRLISPPDLVGAFGGTVPEGIDIETDVGRKIGVWLGLLAAIGITLGGLLSMREEAETAGPATTRAGTEPGGGPPPPPPPPEPRQPTV